MQVLLISFISSMLILAFTSCTCSACSNREGLCSCIAPLLLICFCVHALLQLSTVSSASSASSLLNPVCSLLGATQVTPRLVYSVSRATVPGIGVFSRHVMQVRRNTEEEDQSTQKRLTKADKLTHPSLTESERDLCSCDKRCFD